MSKSPTAWCATSPKLRSRKPSRPSILPKRRLSWPWAAGVRTRVQPGLFEHITTGTNQVAAQAGGQVLALQTQLNTANAEKAAAEKKLQGLASRIPRANVKDAAVRQADGAVVRVPSANVVYINLGQGDHLPVGIRPQRPTAVASTSPVVHET